MARVPDLRRIVIEEFPSEQKETVEKLSIILNHFMEQTINALNGNLDSTNFKREIKNLVTEVNSVGNPKIETLLKTNIQGRVLGIICIKAENLTNSNTYPTDGIFISWTINNDIIRIRNITGLQADQKYNLTLELIG